MVITRPPRNVLERDVLTMPTRVESVQDTVPKWQPGNVLKRDALTMLYEEEFAGVMWKNGVCWQHGTSKTTKKCRILLKNDVCCQEMYSRGMY